MYGLLKKKVRFAYLHSTTSQSTITMIVKQIVRTFSPVEKNHMSFCKKRLLVVSVPTAEFANIQGRRRTQRRQLGHSSQVSE